MLLGWVRWSAVSFTGVLRTAIQLQRAEPTPSYPPAVSAHVVRLQVHIRELRCCLRMTSFNREMPGEMILRMVRKFSAKLHDLDALLPQFEDPSQIAGPQLMARLADELTSARGGFVELVTELGNLQGQARRPSAMLVNRQAAVPNRLADGKPRSLARQLLDYRSSVDAMTRAPAGSPTLHSPLELVLKGVQLYAKIRSRDRKWARAVRSKVDSTGANYDAGRIGLRYRAWLDASEKLCDALAHSGLPETALLQNACRLTSSLVSTDLARLERSLEQADRGEGKLLSEAMDELHHQTNG